MVPAVEVVNAPVVQATGPRVFRLDHCPVLICRTTRSTTSKHSNIHHLPRHIEELASGAGHATVLCLVLCQLFLDLGISVGSISCSILGTMMQEGGVDCRRQEKYCDMVKG